MTFLERTLGGTGVMLGFGLKENIYHAPTTCQNGGEGGWVGGGVGTAEIGMGTLMVAAPVKLGARGGWENGCECCVSQWT